MRARPLWVAWALCAASACAQVPQFDSPNQFRARFQAWQTQALQVVPPQAEELRQSLRDWMQSQGQSLTGLDEPLAQAAQRAKLWGTAAHLLDLANRHADALPPDAYRQLVALGERILLDCQQRLPGRSACTNDTGELTLFSLMLAPARQSEAAASLERLRTHYRAALAAPARSKFSPDPSERCAGWLRWAGEQADPERLPTQGDAVGFARAMQAFSRTMVADCQAFEAQSEGGRLSLWAQAWRALLAGHVTLAQATQTPAPPLADWQAGLRRATSDADAVERSFDNWLLALTAGQAAAPDAVLQALQADPTRGCMTLSLQARGWAPLLRPAWPQAQGLAQACPGLAP